MSLPYWLRWLPPLLHAVLAVLRLVAAWNYRRQGRLEAQKAQLEQDHEILRRAADARRSVDGSAERVRADPRNRDAD